MAREYRNLPDGTYTQSVREYIKAWDAIRLPLEQKLGLKTIGYNPGFLMGDAGATAPHSTVNIPVWLAKRIIEL